MSMLSIFLAVLLRPSVLILLGLLVVAGLTLLYVRGPASLLKWVMDARVWLAIAGFATILAVGDLKKDNADLKAENERQELVIQGKADAQATIEVRQRVREARARQSTTIRDATAHAAATSEPEEIIDATLDAIAQVQEGGLDGRKRADPQPEPERVRESKRPDGNVAP